MLNEQTEALYHKPVTQCTDEELYVAALALCQKRAEALPTPAARRKLYYLSAEFLVGRLLACNLLNLGLWD